MYRIIICFQYALQCTQSLASICHHRGDPMYPFSCPPPLPWGDHFSALGISVLFFVGFTHLFVCVFVLHLHLGSTPFFRMAEVSENHSWLLIIGFFNRLFLVPEQLLSQGPFPFTLEWAVPAANSGSLELLLFLFGADVGHALLRGISSNHLGGAVFTSAGGQKSWLSSGMQAKQKVPMDTLVVCAWVWDRWVFVFPHCDCPGCPRGIDYRASGLPECQNLQILKFLM